MAEKMDETLYRALSRHSKLKQDELLRAALSVPGTFNSSLREGPTAARAYSQSWMQQPTEEPDPLKVAEAKAELLDTLADLEKLSAAGDKDLMKAALERDDSMMKEIIRSVTDVLVATQGNSTELRKNADSLRSTLAKEGVEAIRATTGIGGSGGSGGGGGGVSTREAGILAGRLADSGIIGTGMDVSGASTVTSPVFINTLSNALTEGMSPTDRVRILEEADALSKELTGRPLAANIPDMMEQNPGLNRDIINIDESIKASYASVGSMKEEGLSSSLDVLERAQEMLSKGVSGPAKSEIDRLFNAYKDAIEDPGPGKIAKIAEEVNNIPVPKPRQDLINSLHDALNDIDDPNSSTPPGTRKQAKDQIMRSEAFRKFMDVNGLQDPDTAFVALRKAARAERNRRRVADRLKYAGRDAVDSLKTSTESIGLAGDTSPRPPPTDDEAKEITFGPPVGATAEDAGMIEPEPHDQALEEIDLEPKKKFPPVDIDKMLSGRRVSPNGSKERLEAEGKNMTTFAKRTAAETPDAVRKRMAKLIRDSLGKTA